VTQGSIYPIPGFSEPVSSLTHLVGAAIYAKLAVVLLRRGRGSAGQVASVAIFALSCVLLLSLSGTYHLLAPGGSGRVVLQRLDHDAIFVLIAGTFTPVHIILFRGWMRWAPLLFVWLAAITGITLKTIFFSHFPDWLGMMVYLGLGWFGITSTAILYNRFGLAFILPLLGGAAAYTFGAMLELFQWPTLAPGIIGPHEVLHLAVLAGIGFHWAFVYGIFAECDKPVAVVGL
jgi:channel protein (hemolysin III family)